MKTTSIISLLGLSLLVGCSKQAQDDSEKAVQSAANTLADVAKTIQSVSETADQVKEIGARIKNIKGVEIHSYAEWEYKVVPQAGAGIAESELNQFGKEGWELTTRQGDTLIFKRRKAMIISDKPKQPKDTDK
jgi:hypothetical protein